MNPSSTPDLSSDARLSSANGRPALELVALAQRAAEAHALWPTLVCAIVEQESAWNPWALRYEPAFYDKYIATSLTARRPDLVNAAKLIAGNDVRGEEASRLGALTSPEIPADPTESRARAFSWGLMQVMGQVAREHGFTGALASLCDPLSGSRSAAVFLPRNSPPPKAMSHALCCCGMGQGIAITPPRFWPAPRATGSGALTGPSASSDMPRRESA
jgi:Transglycosylase SLT domain